MSFTEEGAGFFRQHCAGRAGGELMFSMRTARRGKVGAVQADVRSL